MTFRYVKGDRYKKLQETTSSLDTTMGQSRGNAKFYKAKVYKRPVLNMDLMNWWAYQLALQRAVNEQLRTDQTIW